MKAIKANKFVQSSYDDCYNKGLSIYFKGMKKYHLLSREKEKELAIRIKLYNDPIAEADLIQANLRLVVKIASAFQKMFHFPLQDLIQEGNFGLSKAAKKFDPDKNVKFSYYSSFWIKAYILKYIMENWSIVKIGTTQKQRILFFNLNKLRQKMLDNVDSDCDSAQLNFLSQKGINDYDIYEMDQRLNHGDDSLNTPAINDSKLEKLDMIAEKNISADEQLANKEFQAFLEQAIDEFRKELNPRELDIFENRMVSDTPLSLRRLGEKFGISRERVRQVEKNISKRMKDYFNNNSKEVYDYIN